MDNRQLTRPSNGCFRAYVHAYYHCNSSAKNLQGTFASWYNIRWYGKAKPCPLNLKYERYKSGWDTTRYEIASVVREFRESEWVPMGVPSVSTNAATCCNCIEMKFHFGSFWNIIGRRLTTKDVSCNITQYVAETRVLPHKMRFMLWFM